MGGNGQSMQRRLAEFITMDVALASSSMECVMLCGVKVKGKRRALPNNSFIIFILICNWYCRQLQIWIVFYMELIILFLFYFSNWDSIVNYKSRLFLFLFGINYFIFICNWCRSQLQIRISYCYLELIILFLFVIKIVANCKSELVYCYLELIILFLFVIEIIANYKSRLLLLFLFGINYFIFICNWDSSHLQIRIIFYFYLELIISFSFVIDIVANTIQIIFLFFFWN